MAAFFGIGRKFKFKATDWEEGSGGGKDKERGWKMINCWKSETSNRRCSGFIADGQCWQDLC